MTDKALISDYTYRTLESQRADSGNMPVFVLPDDLPQLFRQTTRKTEDRFYVQSLGVLAKKEDEFREFLSHAKKRKAHIISREDNQTFIVTGNCENIVKWWKDARRSGVAKIGARRSADRKKAFSAEGVAKIKDKWPLPSKDFPTTQLLVEADLSLNTIKSILGPRPIAQHNYRMKNGRQIKQLNINPSPREKIDFCGVYIFQIEEGVYKVGMTGNAKRRFKDISQYHKKQMKVVELFNMPIEKALSVEMQAHYFLRKCHAKEYNGREIFKASLETVKRAVNRAIKTIEGGIKYE